MKTIVAPTDFSPVSLNAVNYAADLARAFGSRLSLLHVFQLPVIYSEIPVAADNIDSLVSTDEERLDQLKKEILARTDGKIEITTEVRIGSVIPELEEFCELEEPRCVVMSTHGAGEVQRLLFGSNTIAAVKKLTWPLIVVPAGATFTSIRKIGLACDLKNVEASAPIDEVKALTKDFGAELHVLHVNSDTERYYTERTKMDSRLLQKALGELRPIYHFLKSGEIDEELNEFAEKNHLDLLIVAPKKHGIVEQLFHKSRSKQMVLHSHVPVMSIHE